FAVALRKSQAFYKQPSLRQMFLNGSSHLFYNISMATWNKSCEEQLLDFTTAEKIVIGMMLTIITTVTVIGNMLVVIAVCVVKKLRQPSNYLLVSLAVADLSVAIVVMPFVIVTDLTGGKWLFGEVFCNIFIAMDVMCCTASIMTLCVIRHCCHCTTFHASYLSNHKCSMLLLI
uniref:5-hydroxytryptamine (serotonin) receptor 7c n=1 Tax=Sinocyclocheilus anshuiensis TaxID=1608454 RepID=A0A671Q3N7_9TELE